MAVAIFWGDRCSVDDENAVLDSALRIRGCDGLRVVPPRQFFFCEYIAKHSCSQMFALVCRIGMAAGEGRKFCLCVFFFRERWSTHRRCQRSSAPTPTPRLLPESLPAECSDVVFTRSDAVPSASADRAITEMFDHRDPSMLCSQWVTLLWHHTQQLQKRPLTSSYSNSAESFRPRPTRAELNKN